jgi:hypothetical protein
MFLKLRMERAAGKEENEEAGKVVVDEGEVARSSAGYSIKDTGEREGVARSGMWTRPWREDVVEGRRRRRRRRGRRAFMKAFSKAPCVACFD